MPDQATVLRGLMERHAAQAAARPAAHDLSHGPRTLVLASGKGGVGKSQLALNAAVLLAKSGRSVCLLDTNPGPSHLELLCGQPGYWNLKQVLHGSRRVTDVVVEGPCGVQILSGAAELLDSPLRAPTSAQQQAWTQVTEYLRQFRHVIIDTASGDSVLNRRLMRAADGTWLIATPELTAIADAYSLVKSCAAEGPLPDLEILINRADSASQARDITERLQLTCRNFLQAEILQAGFVPHDISVSLSQNQRQPFVLTDPNSSAARAMAQLARHWRERHAVAVDSFTQRFTPQIRRAA